LPGTREYATSDLKKLVGKRDEKKEAAEDDEEDLAPLLQVSEGLKSTLFDT
jgi:hypothetical protein